tara:strand:+ start:53 stop:319 length:267 start_codon:yes stop_codon:yes gene_type:complete
LVYIKYIIIQLINQPTNQSTEFNMDNIRTNMGTDYTVIIIADDDDDSEGVEVDFLRGNLCNPDEVTALAAILKKWADNTEVIIDLSID